MEIQYIQGVELMKEKIDNCMKRKCNECKYYDRCFGYKLERGENMLEGKVIKDFNDKENKLKKYKIGKKFKAENKRYNELKDKGFVEEGKEVTSKSK